MESKGDDKMGVMIRDADGQKVEARLCFLEDSWLLEAMRAGAVRMGLKFAQDLKLNPVEVN